MNDDLLPCPFCGNADVAVYGDMDSFHVWCVACYTEGPMGESPAAARDRWNRRGREGGE